MTCFYQDFDADERYIVQYNVIRGGKLDVDVAISNPRGTSIYKKNKKKQDTVRFQTEKGQYSFCFGNKFSTVTHKMIYFNMRSEKPESQAAKLGDKTYRVNTKSEEYLERVFQWVTFLCILQYKITVWRPKAITLYAWIKVSLISEAITSRVIF